MKFRRDPADWRNVWDKLAVTTTTSSKHLSIRGSSVPYCPRAYFIDHYLGPFTSEESYMSTVTTARGTVVHEQIQKWLGIAGLLYGQWACPLTSVKECKHITNPILISDGKPLKCPKHGHQLIYHEFEINYKGISGHPDGLLTLTGKPPYILVEFKTAAGDGYGDFPGFHAMRKPYWKHVEQSNLYATASELDGLYDARGNKSTYPIKEVWIWYIHSEYLHRTPKVFSYKPDHEQARQHTKTVKAIKRAIDRRSLPQKVESCKSETNPWCMLASLCSSPELLNLLSEESNDKRAKRKLREHD